MRSNVCKDINWRGSTLDDLITFPQAIRRIAGFELHKVQHGREPTDWKPINEWGMGVIEIRLHGEDGEYRVVYVARFSDVVCVLHCFQKKTQKRASGISPSSKHDIKQHETNGDRKNDA
jgi:phage-related protein